MIIDLRKSPAGQQDYQFTLEKDWWQPERQREQVLALSAPLKIKLNLYKAGDKFVLSGKLDGGIEVECDRCLAPFQRDLKGRFKAFLALPIQEPAKADVELLEKEIDFIRGEQIDLDDIIREQIYLSLPMKCLCSQQCAGLCPLCGGNLNRGDCKCERKSGHPAFAKLKNLKIKGDKS